MGQPFNQGPVHGHFRGGAGGACLKDGLDIWKFSFATLVLYVGYCGLRSYRFIVLGWLLHTSWEAVHHFCGTPIVPFVSTSSGQCAICDVLLAV